VPFYLRSTPGVLPGPGPTPRTRASNERERRETRNRRGPLLLALAVIFIGITASFWVDEWREERQDQENFHPILGEICYDGILDASQLSGTAVANNTVLAYASDLVLRDLGPPLDELFGQLERVFACADPLSEARWASFTPA
jgi:hypothetical protein